MAASPTAATTELAPGAKVSPLPGATFGVQVHGLDLKRDVPPGSVERIKAAVREHRVVVFRGQGVVSGERQVAVSRWFGDLDSVFSQHPASPHHDIFRVSNDSRAGCRGVGRTGWHVDGTFQAAPYSHAIYHIVECPTKGATLFLPLREFLVAQPPTVRQRWERLWMVSDRRGGLAHPLVYTHPATGEPTMLFHLGMIDAFLFDKGSPGQRMASDAETREVLQEIYDSITGPCAGLVYEHKWQPGDFIISDNAAVAHEAHPDTQLPPSAVGLRVMHRSTVRGTVPPAK